MKRGLLFLSLFIFISILGLNVNASSWRPYPIMNNKIKLGDDTYTIEYKEPYNLFRINYNNIKYVEFETNGYSLSYLKFNLISDYIYVYGSVEVLYDKEAYEFYHYPVFYKFDLDLNKIDFFEYLDVDDRLSSYFTSIVEGQGNHIYALMAHNIIKDSINSYGEYILLDIMNGLIINSFKIETGYLQLMGIYDELCLYSNDLKIYLDKDFHSIDSYDKSSKYVGVYELNEDYIINDSFYNTHSCLSAPGRYVIRDVNNMYNSKELYIEPEIVVTGEMMNGYYIDHFEYKISGGTVYINGKPSYLNGNISGPGIYKFKVYGIDDNVFEYEYKIKPKLLFDINEEIKVGDIITFSGNAKLNGNKIESGYEIKSGGDYILDLYISNELVESYSFSVLEEPVSKTEKEITYIIYLFIISILVLTLLVMVIVEYIKYKRLKNMRRM